MRTRAGHRKHRLLLCCLSALALAAAPPGPAYRVKDINTVAAEAFGGQSGVSTIVAGNTLYFTISDALWKSDGTVGGTQRLGGTGTIRGPYPLAARGNIMYFTADESGHGRELWRTDGTAEGTWMLRDINPGGQDSNIRSLVDFQGQLYFGADDGIHGYELWKTDGTREGTVLAADFNPGPKGSALYGLAVGGLRADGESLAFSESTYAPGQPAAVYTSNGTSRSLLKGQFINDDSATICPGACYGFPPANFLPYNGMTYFIADNGISGWELWRGDERTLETSLVKDICPGRCNGPGSLQVLNGRIFFFANDGVHGWEPWTSDGTEAGTRLVKDIFPGSGSSSSSYGTTVTVGGAVVFPARSGAGGWEIWRSDGTEAGTFLLASGSSSSGLIGVVWIIPIGDNLFFLTVTETGTYRLWKTDLTGAQVSIVTDLVSNAVKILNVGGTLYFLAPGPAGFSLWKVNESPGGTEVIRVVYGGGNAPSGPLLMSELDGSLLFFAWNGKDFGGLWRTDGTDAGTQPIARVGLPGYSNGVDGLFAPFRGSIFFNGYESVHGSELWRTDGTPGGTRLVKDIGLPGGTTYPWLLDSSPCALTAVGDTLYFGATDGDRTQGLWKTDGTEIGTEFIEALGLDCNGRPTGLVPFQGHLYFSGIGRTLSLRSGLWRTDGTTPGTELIRPVSIYGLTPVNGRLVFAGSGAPEEHGLWTSDGTTAGTVFLKQFNGIVAPFVRTSNGVLFLGPKDTGTSRLQLWRTDGTSNGTTFLADFSFTLVSREVVSIGSRIFLVGEDAEHGTELWTSDGTLAGTHIVKDIAAGGAGSFPRHLAAIDGVLLFSARDPLHGDELWRSDGTEAGTFLLQDICPGPAPSFPGGPDYSSLPGNFTKAGSLVYFTASDGETGEELWAMPLSALRSAPSGKPNRVQDQPGRR